MIQVQEKLTRELLNAMSSMEIITWGEEAQGAMLMDSGGAKMVRWVAYKEGDGWAIRYHFSDKDGHWIMKFGNRLGMSEHIRRLVPCDDDVFALYRY